MSDHRTFVSYSRADSPFAVKLASDLRANGASVWIDQLDIAAGARWDDAIEEALRGSARVIVLLSPKAVASQNVLDEVSFAMDEGKTLVPVLVEPCTIPMRLRRLQYVDFTSGYETALGRLLVTLGVARTPASRGAAPPAEAPRVEPAPSPAAPSPATAAPEPEPPGRYEPSFASTRAETEGGQRRLLWMAGAGVAAVVMIAAFLWTRSGDTPATQPASTESASDTPPPAATSQPPPAPEGTASTAVRRAEAGSSFEALDRVLGTQTADAGLQSLRQLTRGLTARTALSDAELRQLADAQMAACEGVADAQCKENASEQVTLLLNMVCRRQSGRPPSGGDAMATLKYDTMVSGCEQTYSSTLLDQFNRKALDAIRSIRND
jgi:hypothetical protein